MAAHTVTISSQQDYMGCGGAPMKITVYGTLYFVTGNKLKMPCGSAVYLMPGGSVNPGGGGGNSNTIEICSDVYWKAGDGPLTGPSCLPPTQPGCGAILPVELVSFTGNACSDNKVCLQWVTATEKNNEYFDVERSSDAVDFNALFYVNTKAVNGNSNTKLTYDALDTNPVAGTSYYRLKQVDKDRRFTYSPIVAVEIIPEKNIKFVVYPNPNSGEFTADISGLENNHEIKVVLRDMKGRSLFESSFYTFDQNANIQIVPQSKLKSGIYICSLYLEEIEYKVKVVVDAG